MLRAWSVVLRVWSVVPVQGLRGTGSKPTLVAPHPGLRLGVRGCGDVTLLAHVDGDDWCRLLMPGGVSTSCRGNVKAAELDQEPQNHRRICISLISRLSWLNNIKWPF